MKEKALQVLLVEDNAGDVRLLREMFNKEKPDSFELTHLPHMSEGAGRTQRPRASPTIVLTDWTTRYEPPPEPEWIPKFGIPQAFCVQSSQGKALTPTYTEGV